MKNGNLRPTDVTKASGKKVWWLGKCGHEWKSSIGSRINMKSGCPYCAGQKVLVGFNDLVTTDPIIANEWHPSRNGDLLPCDVTRGMHAKVWWKGDCGHEWQASINNRANHNQRCPICDKEMKSSFPEQAIYYYLKQAFSDTRSGDKDSIGIELDVYIPSLRTAIEYDGARWHAPERLRNDKSKCR